MCAHFEFPVCCEDPLKPYKEGHAVSARFAEISLLKDLRGKILVKHLETRKAL